VQKNNLKTIGNESNKLSNPLDLPSQMMVLSGKVLTELAYTRPTAAILEKNTTAEK
jgi:hypothetical protein